MDIVRKVVAGLVAITACLVYVHASHAAAPLQAGQAPGYYRMVPATSRSSRCRTHGALH